MNLNFDTAFIDIETNCGASENFRDDVLRSLARTPKTLSSKYFYDRNGDRLFQRIMDMPEYYLTTCELDIFRNSTRELISMLTTSPEPFDLIELGAGDATKSSYLLRHLVEQGIKFTYMPIDISEHILSVLQERLTVDMPDMDVVPLHGEYFNMLDRATSLSPRRKVLLFLGSNIGNMEFTEATEFCRGLYNRLAAGDMVLMGFDLKKNPRIILDAYNDKEGITAAFNMNLLTRINRELGADFQLDRFEHYQTYDPFTGACRSYLISLIEQKVVIDQQQFLFAKDEPIFVEISQKFSLEDVKQLAHNSCFNTVGLIADSKSWFINTCWEKG